MNRFTEIAREVLLEFFTEPLVDEIINVYVDTDQIMYDVLSQYFASWMVDKITDRINTLYRAEESEVN